MNGNDLLRKLTPYEVEYILDGIGNFRIDPNIAKNIDGPIFEELRANLRPLIKSSGISRVKPKYGKYEYYAVASPDGKGRRTGTGGGAGTGGASGGAPKFWRSITADEDARAMLLNPAERTGRMYRSYEEMRMCEVDADINHEHMGSIEYAKWFLKHQFLKSIAIPGISPGARAASTNMEPITQKVLKSAQAAGSKDNDNPVNELLAVKSERNRELIRTCLNMNIPPVEAFTSRVSPVDLSMVRYYSMDEVLDAAMNFITPLLDSAIIRTASGAVGIVNHASNINSEAAAKYGRSGFPTKDEYYVCEVTFSIAETLKLWLAPFQVLNIIKRHLEDRQNTTRPHVQGNVAILGAFMISVDAESFVIGIWSDYGTAAISAMNSILEINLDANANGFEIVYTPIFSMVSSIEEIGVAALGRLAPQGMRRMWRLHINTTKMLPAENLALLLHNLGMTIWSCLRNAAGQISSITVYSTDATVDSARLGSGSGSGAKFQDWYSAVTEAFNDLAGPDLSGNIPTWKMQREHQYASLVIHRSIVYNAKPAKYLEMASYAAGDSLYDWKRTWCNNIVTFSEVMTSYVARQNMEYEWITSVTENKVPQSDVDMVTMFACGTGPKLQPVKAATVKQGGPFMAHIDNPKKEYLKAAASGKLFSLACSSITTGSINRNNGPASIMVVPADTGDEKFVDVNDYEKLGITSAADIQVNATRASSSSDVPKF